MPDKRVYVEKDNFGNIITGDENTIINNSNNGLSSFGHALYYPHIHLTDEEWLKHAFLFWDKISRIVPHAFEPQDNEDIIRIKQETNFLEDYHPEKKIIRDTFRSFSESLDKHVDYNLLYKNNVRKNSHSRGKYELLLKEREFKTLKNGNYIHIEKMDQDLIKRLSQLGFAVPGENEWSSWIKIDNVVGESYMSYLAKTISNEKSIPMVTDTEELYSSQSAYQERRYENQFKEELGYLLIDMVVPKDISNITMKQLIEFRLKYNDQRMQFFDEINKLSSLLPDIDNNSALNDALNYHNKLLLKQTNELKKVFKLNGIDSVIKPAAMSIGVSMATDYIMPTENQLLGLSAGLLFGVVSTYSELDRRRIENQQHPMSYLLNIQSKLDKKSLFQKIQHISSRANY